MKIFLASDHAGFALKESLKTYLGGLGYEIEDMGAHALDEKDDYPDFVRPCAEAVMRCEKDSPSTGSGQSQCRGIVIGGSGQGEAIVANRTRGIRAAVRYSYNEEIIRLSREHNDANILSLGARFLTEEEAKKAVALWLNVPSATEERHLRRINKIDTAVSCF